MSLGQTDLHSTMCGVGMSILPASEPRAGNPLVNQLGGLQHLEDQHGMVGIDQFQSIKP